MKSVDTYIIEPMLAETGPSASPDERANRLLRAGLMRELFSRDADRVSRYAAARRRESTAEDLAAEKTQRDMLFQLYDQIQKMSKDKLCQPTTRIDQLGYFSTRPRRLPGSS